MKLTEEFLTERGFQLSYSLDHNYRPEFTHYYDDVERAIILVSIQNIDSESEYNGFDVWFWGKALGTNNYKEIDSHLRITSVEEFESLMKLLRDD